ncbi:MAG: hypothetical protein ACXVEF_26605 [Polyangiales bacterium]
MDADITATFAIDETESTEQIPALTVEQTLFDQPLPIPPPMQGEPAYLVEVRPPHRAPSLLAIRTTLHDAISIATTVHPAFADVTIRELALPCDAESLARAVARQRVWNRTADGQWFLEC